MTTAGSRAELARAREIALEAGAVLLAERGALRSIDYKSATDMVTDVDRRVEDLAVGRLGESFPDDGVRAEEGGGGGGRSGREWIMDPLDGTTNYVHGHPFYAFSLACVDADGARTGVVFAPELDELYTAVRGGGVRLERPRLETARDLPPRTAVDLERALLATGFPYLRDVLVERNCDLVRRFLMRRCHGVRRGGSAALDLCHVASGRLDGYWEMSLKPWDVAAGVLAAREAGAVVTDFDGVAGELDGVSVVAAAPGLHAVMIAEIDAARRAWGER